MTLENKVDTNLLRKVGNKVKASLTSRIIAYSMAGGLAFLNPVVPTAKAADVVVKGIVSDSYRAFQAKAATDKVSGGFRLTTDLANNQHPSFFAGLDLNELHIYGGVSPKTVSEKESIDKHYASSWWVGGKINLASTSFEEEGFFNGEPGFLVGMEYLKYDMEQSLNNATLNFNGELNQTAIYATIGIPVYYAYKKSKVDIRADVSGEYHLYKQGLEQIRNARLRGLGPEFDGTVVLLAPEQSLWWVGIDCEKGWLDLKLYVNSIDYISDIGKSESVALQQTFKLDNGNIHMTPGITLQRDTIEDKSSVTPYFYLGVGFFYK